MNKLGDKNAPGCITMTRGDTPSFIVKPKIVNPDTGERTDYVPQEGDKIIFAMKKSAASDEILVKEIPTDTMRFTLEEEDTKNLKYGVYLYEVSLKRGSFICTFITNKQIMLTTELY
ncbi:MAG: hypothetical protein KBT27_06655 [Prevotellaceae bacterium]|nr:hypothetical protein [Candidatus Faecinaster equi]